MSKKKSCPTCGCCSLQRFGKVPLKVFTRRSWQIIFYQRYRCADAGHVFHLADLIGMYSRKVIEYLAYRYLRSLSFQQVRIIVGAWFEASVITKL